MIELLPNQVYSFTFINSFYMTWLIFIAEAGPCKKCSASGVTVGGTPNCCPVGQTCDQAGGGSCIAAEPGTGTNNPECKKVSVGGCKIWCPFGTTCSAPDDTGKCMPVKKGTTTDTPSSSSAAESSSEAPSTAQPPSTATTSSTRTTTTYSPSTSTTSSTSTRSWTNYII